jgi:hypothetical protein
MSSESNSSGSSSSQTNSTNTGIEIDLKNCRIISDPEGYDINQLLNNKDIKNGNILILGDLLDSTFIGKPSEEQFKTKSYNIRNLDLVNNNENIFIAMGNRDLNKIKLRQLLALKEEDKFLEKSNTEEGNIFETIVNKLKQVCSNDTNPWVVEKLTEANGFSPFWNKGRDKELWKKDSTKQKKHTCEERFKIIFGPDGKEGTMSAQNLLETIPMELEALEFITSGFANDPETKAACVIAFFKLALMESDDNLNIQFTKNNINIVGILRRFYSRPQNFVCAYKEFGNEKNKQIALFSHGGITKSFIETNGFYEFKLNSSCTDKCITATAPPTTGGYVGKGENVGLDTIKTRINAYNTHYMATIKACLDESISKDKTTSENALYLLATSAPTKIKISEEHSYDAEKLSPIMPGIFNMRKTSIICETAHIYNFFGHKPDGYGPVVDRFLEDDSVIRKALDFNTIDPKTIENTKLLQGISYNINCDISNTILGNLGRVDGGKLAENYSYLTSSIENNKLVLKNHSEINITDNVKKQFGNYLTDNTLKSDDTYNLLDLPVNVLGYKNKAKWSALGKYIFNSNSYYLLTIQESYKIKPVLLDDEGKVQHTTEILAGGKRRTIRKTNRKNKRRNTSKLNKSNKRQRSTKRQNKHKNTSKTKKN